MASTTHGKLGSNKDMRSVIAQLESIKSPAQVPASKPVTPSNKPSDKSSKPPPPSTNKPSPGSPPAAGFKLPPIAEATALKRTPGASPAAVKATPTPSVALRPVGLTPASKPGAPVSSSSNAETSCSVSPGTVSHPVVPRKPSQVQTKPTAGGNSSHVTSTVASRRQDVKSDNDSNDNTATAAGSTAPPWQSLVRKPKPPPAAATDATPATSTTPASDSVSNNVTESQDTQTLKRLNSDVDKDDRASKVKSLRHAFESPANAQTVNSVVRRQKSVDPNMTAVKEHGPNKDNEQQQQQQQQKPKLEPDSSQQLVGGSTLDCNDNQVKQSNRITDTDSTLNPASNSLRKAYRLRPVPVTTTAPPRKPAKPPNVDLGVYIADTFDDVYDDATTVTSRASVVSQIEEYTEEEEERERQLLHVTTSSAHDTVGDNDADEIYDDVGNPDVEEFDEIYQELD